MSIITLQSTRLPIELVLSPLDKAIVETVAYADVFNYPLTKSQIHRYLHGMTASLADIEAALAGDRLVPDYLELNQGFFTLAGRDYLIEIRMIRDNAAQKMWPHAVLYGKRLGKLPFVRMVALTGSLSMNNPTELADFDFLVVAEKGRVWTSRAFALLLRRYARKHGVTICPNLIISEQQMVFNNRNIYTAHELAQMIPITGLNVYQRLRELNSWSIKFLPNAGGIPDSNFSRYPTHSEESEHGWVQVISEPILRSKLGNKFELWEMNRKTKRLSQQSDPSNETLFSADWCQGHFQHHGTHSLDNFRQRIEKYLNLPARTWHE